MLKLAIQAPIIQEDRPTSIYHLEVHSEHGDADHSEYTVHWFKPNAEDMTKLYMILEIFEAYKDAGRPYFIMQKEWVNLINDRGIDVSSVEYIEDWISELLAWDMTTNGQYLTTFQGYSLTFYDVNGLKRPVTVERVKEDD